MYGYNERDGTGNLKISVREPVAGSAGLRINDPTPQAQIDATYGILSDCETFVGASGTVSAVDEVFLCQTGTTIGGYGVIRSKRACRPRPGEPAIYRFDAAFDPDNAIPLSLQFAGAFSSSCGFVIGYDGENLGVMHRTGGRHELRVVTVTGAAGGSEANTETWTYQPDWNLDRLDGTGLTGKTLDASKLNLFSVLVEPSVGATTMYVQTSAGELVPFHRFVFSNTQTAPALTNSSLKVGWVSASLGSSGTNITVRGTSGSSFIAGQVLPLRRPRGYSVTNASVDTTLEAVLAIRVRNSFEAEGPNGEVCSHAHGHKGPHKGRKGRRVTVWAQETDGAPRR